ncbi:DUF2306 domain-containing protein [Streptomyces roseoverticillatus]|uniref:DUF2306 domain-containing protein n=1 Tax=Streptomyces roseoverticillatus TaxID=66429 RepID=UPI0006942C71|nr:DUF2306 domain-containing protein [Streptomyces roseoverticillatus]
MSTMTGRQRRGISTGWLITMAGLSLVVTALAIRVYLPPDMATSRVPPRSDLHYALLVCHIFTAAVAALLGPLQFWPRLRARRPRLHRWTGRAYFFAGVFPSILFAIPVVWFTPVGFSNQAALGTLDVLWAVTGVSAYRAALQRRYADHRLWMIRNFSMTFVAISSRIIQPFIEHAVAAQAQDPLSYGGDPLAAAHDIASASAWLGLVINLIATEAWIQYRYGRRPERGKAVRGRAVSPSHTRSA